MTTFKSTFNETISNMKMSWQFIRNQKKSLFFIIFLSLGLSVISVVIPVLSANLLLKLSNGLLEELLYVALFIFFIEITRNILSFFFRKIMESYLVSSIMNAQLKMFEETLKIETAVIDQNSSGVFIDRINNDTNEIISIFSDLISSFVDFISNVGVLVAILVISPYMFIFFVITSLIIGLVDRKGRDIYFKRNKIFKELKEKRTGLISEVVRGVRDVKLLGAKDGILKKTNSQLKDVAKERKKMVNISCRFNFVSGCIRDLVDVLFIVLGIYLVFLDKLNISNFVVLYMYRGKIENLLTFYNRSADLIKSYNLSASRVAEVLGNTYTKESDTGKELGLVKGKIEFKNVCFGYTEDEVLDNVSFTILPGEKVGFVGSSGSGKSTIFNLITKLYSLEDGKILIDDIDINDVSNNSLRSNLALIPQNPYIFNFSILDNLKIANPKVSMDEVIDSCKKADIYDRIIEFEAGFDTKVGEGGVTLSGGEKQRIAIARSLIKKSNILLFDEATSALDNITQDKVQKAIYALDKDKTVLIIAHRLSTVIHCDKIIVVDNGKIVDIGTHQELLDRCDKYQELFKYEEVENY